MVLVNCFIIFSFFVFYFDYLILFCNNRSIYFLFYFWKKKNLFQNISQNIFFLIFHIIIFLHYVYSFLSFLQIFFFTSFSTSISFFYSAILITPVGQFSRVVSLILFSERTLKLVRHKANNNVTCKD